MRKALQQYQSVNLESDINSATPYRITQMLLEGCLRFMKQAKFAIEKKDFEKKSLYISKAEAIIATLAGSLDHNVSPDLASNLLGLYDFVLEKIISASLSMDVSLLDEAIEIVGEIKAGWDAIPADEVDKAELIRARKNG